MKKLILLLTLVLCTSFTLRAEPHGKLTGNYDLEYSAQMGEKILRFLKLGNVEWARYVRTEENLIRSTRFNPKSSYVTSTENFEQLPIKERDKQAFEQRFVLFQQAVARNSALKNYTPVVPIPADIAQIPTEDVNYLLRFLGQPIEEAKFDKQYAPQAITLPQRGVTEIKLRAPNNTLILRVDSFKKKVYFFLNEY